MPGGPDEGPRLHELLTQMAEADRLAEELLAEIVPRPSPSQYPALRQEVARFTGSLASVSRVRALMDSLEVGRLLSTSQ